MDKSTCLSELETYLESFRLQSDQVELALKMMSNGRTGSFVRARLREVLHFSSKVEEKEFLQFFISRKLIFPRGERFYNMTPLGRKILDSYLKLCIVRQEKKQANA